MAILLRMPKDLGEGVLCASAVKKLKSFAEGEGEELCLVGSPLMHGWLETFAGENFNYKSLEDVPLKDLSSAVDFNIHDDKLNITKNVPCYKLEGIEHVEKGDDVFDEGAIIAPEHIVKMFEETLKDMGALKREDVLEVTAIPARLKRAEVIQAIHQKLGLDSEKPIGLLMPACAPNRLKKRWAPENFAKVARFMEEKGVQPVLVGGPSNDEMDLCAHICQLSEAHIVNACGQTKIDELCSLASSADIALGGDTGPVHICAASGAMTFALFGKGSDPNSWRPLSTEEAAHSIWVENLAELTPEEVWQSVEDIRHHIKKERSHVYER